MGILSVKERKIGRSASIDREFKRTYNRVFYVETDNRYVGAIPVTAAIGIGIGNTYNDGFDTDTGAFVVGIDPRCVDEDGRGWEVAVTYGPYDPNIRPADPTARDLQVSFDSATYEEIMDEDADGVAVLNAAGDAFENPITRDDPRPILTIIRNESTINPTLDFTYRRATNSDMFLGAPIDSVKARPIKSTLMRDQDIGYYWQRTYEFEYNPDGWKSHPLNQGYRELYASGTKKKPIMTQGQPVTSEAPLATNGTALAVGGTPNFLTFRKYPSLPFAVFDFDEADFPGLTW